MAIVESRSARPAELFELTPTLASAYVLRTLLTAIFDHSPDRATAQTPLQGWTEPVKAAGLSCFDKLLNTLHNWQDGILNYFDGWHTRGFVEGLRSLAKIT
jgi:transposase